MIIVTGANGFIGSNVVEYLVGRTTEPIIAVDKKVSFTNRNYLSSQDSVRVLFHSELFDFIEDNYLLISTIIVLGGNSDTLETNLSLLLKDNYIYPKKLIEKCVRYGIKVIYSSSASMCEFDTSGRFLQYAPKNEYAYSKFKLDTYVKDQILPICEQNVIGLRFFNVYGKNEEHKLDMSSMVFKIRKQVQLGEIIELFQGEAGLLDGEQKRDFVSVDFICELIFCLLTRTLKSQIIDVGSSQMISFNRLIETIYSSYYGVSNISVHELKQEGILRYTPMPKKIRSYYQNHTRADSFGLKSNDLPLHADPIESIRQFSVNCVVEKSTESI